MFVQLLILAGIVQLTHGHAIGDVDRLIKAKLANYNTNLRPILNQSQPVQVTIGLEIVSVKQFDEVSEKIEIIAVHNMYWMDPLLAWNASDYGGVEMITINESEAWKPTLILVNTFDKLEEVGGSGFIVRINSSGLVQWYPGSVLSAACQVDTTYYPYDTQSCNFTFVAWSFSPAEIQFFMQDDKVWTNYYTPSGIWDLVDSKTYRLYKGTMMKFEIMLKRKPGFIFVNVILPIVFMSCLNLIAFLIPTDSGERISYCITVLLSIAVFLTIVGDNLPKTSNPMSILSYYLISVLAISIAITLSTIFSLRMYFHEEDDPVPAFWKGFVRISRCYGAKRKRVHRKNRASDCKANIHGKDFESIPTKYEYSRTTTSQYPKYAESQRRVYNVDSVDNNNSTYMTTAPMTMNIVKVPDDDSGVKRPVSHTDDVSWKNVSIAIDKFCLFLYLILTLTGTLWCLIKMILNV